MELKMDLILNNTPNLQMPGEPMSTQPSVLMDIVIAQTSQQIAALVKLTKTRLTETSVVLLVK
jgi:hypothetical protein